MDFSYQLIQLSPLGGRHFFRKLLAYVPLPLPPPPLFFKNFIHFYGPITQSLCYIITPCKGSITLKYICVNYISLLNFMKQFNHILRNSSSSFQNFTSNVELSQIQPNLGCSNEFNFSQIQPILGCSNEFNFAEIEDYMTTRDNLSKIQLQVQINLP